MHINIYTKSNEIKFLWEFREKLRKWVMFIIFTYLFLYYNYNHLKKNISFCLF